jgi:hypothetical protein
MTIKLYPLTLILAPLASIALASSSPVLLTKQDRSPRGPVAARICREFIGCGTYDGVSEEKFSSGEDNKNIQEHLEIKQITNSVVSLVLTTFNKDKNESGQKAFYLVFKEDGSFTFHRYGDIYGRDIGCRGVCKDLHCAFSSDPGLELRTGTMFFKGSKAYGTIGQLDDDGSAFFRAFDLIKKDGI